MILQDLPVPLTRIFDPSAAIQVVFRVGHRVARDIHNVIGVVKDAQAHRPLLFIRVVAVGGEALFQQLLFGYRWASEAFMSSW